jgi:hypothetical protein
LIDGAIPQPHGLYGDSCLRAENGKLILTAPDAVGIKPDQEAETEDAR